MNNKKGAENASIGRTEILRLVRTPLAFFTLVVLIVEAAMIGTAVTVFQGSDRTYLVVGSLGLMFLLVAVVATISVFRPEALSGKRPSEFGNNYSQLSTNQKIAVHQQAIEKLTTENILQGFNVPEGYKSEISTVDKFRFGFCYPQDWEFSTFPQEFRYGMAVDLESAQQRGFARNMNVIIDDVSQMNSPLEELYETSLNDTLAMLPEAELVLNDKDFVFQGLRAARWGINWTPQVPDGKELTCYQVVVADGDKRNLYTISFTTTRADFASSRPLFDNIANTFRL